MPSQPAKALNRVPERRQRRHPRYRSEFPVTVTLFSGKEHLRLDAHCRDLSQGGMGVLIATDLPVGEVASLGFSLPNLSERWDVRAVLRCRRGYQYGFEFLALSDQQGKMLAAYVPSLERADSDVDKVADRKVFSPEARGARNT
jgi:c-di-GMP-binding flagellar brake protein YcgR